MSWVTYITTLGCKLDTLQTPKESQGKEERSSTVNLLESFVQEHKDRKDSVTREDL